MTQFLGALLLTGVLGYIPYKYLTMIGLVSEKNKIINTPVLFKKFEFTSVAYRSKSKYLVSNYFCFNSACI